MKTLNPLSKSCILIKNIKELKSYISLIKIDQRVNENSFFFLKLRFSEGQGR